MGELLKQEQSSKQRRINNYQPLGNQAELTIFNTLERNEQISGKSQRKANASELAYLIATIKNVDVDVDVDEIIDSNPQRPNTRSNLQQQLEHNHLIGRDVLISGENIKSDCGDLIACEEESGVAILLKTTTRGYQVLDPKRMKSAKDIHQCPEILEQNQSTHGVNQQIAQQKRLKYIRTASICIRSIKKLWSIRHLQIAHRLDSQFSPFHWA